jgi:hypothetical protein
MIRTLNVMAILALIGSATMLYQVKYETILVNEKLRQAEAALVKEKDAIAVLKAEWELLNRPARLAMLAQPEPGMQTLTVRQIARATDIPKALPEQDKIGAALDGLMTGSIPAADAQKKITPRPTTPLAATPRPQPRITAATPRPDAARAPKVVIPARPLPRVATATSAPLALRPPASLGSTGPAPKRDAIGEMLRPPAPVGQPRR